MKERSFTIGVVISTYNSPAWLEKVLWGYLYQTHPADEIVIADDGSRDDTRALHTRHGSWKANLSPIITT